MKIRGRLMLQHWAALLIKYTKKYPINHGQVKIFIRVSGHEFHIILAANLKLICFIIHFNALC